MGFAKPIEQNLFGNLLIRIHGFMYLKDIIRGDEHMTESGLIIFLVALLFIVIIAVVVAVVSSVSGAAAAIADEEDGEDI